MQNELPKQYLIVNGKPIIEHTIAVFLANSEVHGLMVCLPPDDQRFNKLASFKSHRVATTSGGDSRAKSVLNGLRALDADSLDWVLVHDAARPCLSSQMLQRFVTQLRGEDVGGIMAVRAKDTLKRSTANDCIEATIDRSDIWQAQTPQMFRYGILEKALNQAIEHGAEITDEASSIELLGHQPKLVEGDARNLKVTTREDLELVEFLLRAQQARLKPSTLGS